MRAEVDTEPLAEIVQALAQRCDIAAVAVEDQDACDPMGLQAFGDLVDDGEERFSPEREGSLRYSIQCGEMPTGTGVATMTCGKSESAAC